MTINFEFGSRFVLLIAVSLTFLISGCDKPETPEKTLETALALKAEGDYPAALIVLKNLVADNRRMTEGRWQLGLINLAMGNGEFADKEFRAAQDLGMNSPELSLARARAQLLTGNFDDVLADFEAGDINIDGTDAERADIQAVVGHAYHLTGHPEAATRQYDAAITLEPNNDEALLGRARLAVHAGDLDLAREHLGILTVKHPEFAPGWSYLGYVEAATNNPEAAIKAYTEAIANRFDIRADLLNRAFSRIAVGQLEEAEEDVELLRQKAPKHDGTKFVTGLLALHKNDIDTAREALQQAYTATPDYLPVIYYMGLTNFMLGHYEQAQSQLEKFHYALPLHPLAAKLLAAIRIASRDYESAEAILIPLLSKDPEDIDTLELLANAAAPQGRPEESVEYLRRVVAKQPGAGYAQLNLSMALLFSGDYEAATEQLKKAVESSKEIGAAQKALFQAYMANADFESAIDMSRALIEAHPDEHIPLNYLGLAYMGKGDFGKARDAFNNGLILAPDDLGLINNIAVLELRSNNADAAIKIFEQALSEHEGHLALTQQLLVLYARRGEIDKAKNILEAAVTKSPEALVPRVFLARYYITRNEPSNALEILNPIRDAFGKDARVLDLVGRAQRMAGDNEAAVETFRQLLDEVPQSAVAQFNLANSLITIGKLGAARTALETALESNTNYVPARVSLARIQMMSGDVSAANSHLAELKELAPNHPEIIALEGWLAYMQDEPERAIPFFERALELMPDSKLLIDLSFAHAQVKDMSAAVAIHESWLKEYPNDAQVRTSLGTFYETLSRESDAIAAYKQALESNGEYVPALNNLAWILRKKDIATAYDYSKRAYDLAPTDPAISDTLAVIMLSKGEKAQALELSRKVLERSPDDPGFQYHYALALVANGEKTEAISVLESIIENRRPFLGINDANELLARLQGS